MGKGSELDYPDSVRRAWCGQSLYTRGSRHGSTVITIRRQALLFPRTTAFVRALAGRDVPGIGATVVGGARSAGSSAGCAWIAPEYPVPAAGRDRGARLSGRVLLDRARPAESDNGHAHSRATSASPGFMRSSLRASPSVYRGVVVGLGGIARTAHLPAFQSDPDVASRLRIVGIMDESPTAAP